MNPWDGRRSLLAVLSSATVAGLSVGVIAPVITLALERRGVDAALIGLLAATPPVTTFVTGPIMPRIIARLGTLPSIFLGVFLAAAGIAALTLTDDLALWFVLRVVAALGFTINWIASEVWINAVATPRNRGVVTGLYGALLSGGLACGPLVVHAVGSTGDTPFLVGACLLLASAAPILIARGVAPELPRGHGTELLRAVREAPLAMAAAVANGVTFAVVFALLPLYGLRRGFGENDAVLMLTAVMAGNILMQVPIGRLIDRLTPARMLALCAVMGLAGCLLLPAVGAPGPALWALLAVWGGFIGGTYTVGLTLLGQAVPLARLASGNTAFIMVFEMGSLTGPPLAGFAMDLWNPYGMLAVVAAPLALLLPYLALRRVTAPSGP
jgi:MFS family permease